MPTIHRWLFRSAITSEGEEAVYSTLRVEFLLALIVVASSAVWPFWRDCGLQRTASRLSRPSSSPRTAEAGYGVGAGAAGAPPPNPRRRLAIAASFSDREIRLSWYLKIIAVRLLGKRADRDVVLLHRVDIALARHGDAVLRALELRLQSRKFWRISAADSSGDGDQALRARSARPGPPGISERGLSLMSSGSPGWCPPGAPSVDPEQHGFSCAAKPSRY